MSHSIRRRELTPYTSIFETEQRFKVPAHQSLDSPALTKPTLQSHRYSFAAAAESVSRHGRRRRAQWRTPGCGWCARVGRCSPDFSKRSLRKTVSKQKFIIMTKQKRCGEQAKNLQWVSEIAKLALYWSAESITYANKWQNTFRLIRFNYLWSASTTFNLPGTLSWSSQQTIALGFYIWNGSSASS